MAGMLTAQVIGRLGKDPETRFLPDGTNVASFSVAVDTGTKDKPSTEWVNISAFRRLGEVAQEYLSKGRSVYVAGRLKTRSYEASDGTKRFSLELQADTLQLIDSRPQDDEQRDPPPMDESEIPF